jgi:hypothetical protein
VWSVLIASFSMLNRIVQAEQQPRLAALVRDRVRPIAPAQVDAASRRRRAHAPAPRRPGARDGRVGDDRAIQARAAELYQRGTDIDPNVLPAIIGVLAHAGDGAHDEFLKRFGLRRRLRKSSASSTRWRLPPAQLLGQTLARAINSEFTPGRAVRRALAAHVGVRARGSPGNS